MNLRKLVDRAVQGVADLGRFSIYRKKEEQEYEKLVKNLTKEASFFTGREITEQEIIEKGKENA